MENVVRCELASPLLINQHQHLCKSTSGGGSQSNARAVNDPFLVVVVKATLEQ